MIISAIVAMSTNRVIGKDNKLPWHLPADLRYFKKVTMGKPILMGRKTYQSIGKPLPGRCNVVISRDLNFEAPGCVTACSIDVALQSVEYSNEIFVIGGAALFQEMMPQIQRLYLTKIHHKFDGDVYFPEVDLSSWEETKKEDCFADEENKYDYTFEVWDRLLSS